MRMTKPGIPGTGNERTRKWPNPGTTEPGNDRTRDRKNSGTTEPGNFEPGIPGLYPGSVHAYSQPSLSEHEHTQSLSTLPTNIDNGLQILNFISFFIIYYIHHRIGRQPLLDKI